MILKKRLIFNGFTLAEVLITLGIIGIIAAMTIPTLMQNQRNAATITSVKKAYSTLTNAFTSAVQDNGLASSWPSVGGSLSVFSTLETYLKFSKSCNSNTGCFPDVDYKTLNGGGYENIEQDSALRKAQLADGSLMAIGESSSCGGINICGQVLIDINGAQGPNTYGRDLFDFAVIENKVILSNFPISDGWDAPSSCNKNSCWYPTLWIITKGNMDYLHVDQPQNN